MLLGGVEAGGTKFVCAVGDESGRIIDKTSFPTGAPDETLARAKQFFDRYAIEALGFGSFGPVDLNKTSRTYGHILNTPKVDWRHYPLLPALQSLFSVPVYVDTDVNLACLGEYQAGAGRNSDSCLYITVGTGIGAGFVASGAIFQGVSHPEMGHVWVRPHPDDTFEGACPSHGACIEGLASGKAIEARTGQPGHALAHDDPAWTFEAYYLAQAIMNYYLTLSPEKLIIGGGVMKHTALYPMIRESFMDLLNDYLQVTDVNQLIVAPELKDEQGIKGAISLPFLRGFC